MKKWMVCFGSFVLAALCLWGCAPSAAYKSAESLKDTSAVAEEASVDTGEDAAAAEQIRVRMKKDIDSIKAAEKLFDQESSIVLSY